MSKLLTPSQLSERWNIHVGTLRNWRTKGKGLPYIKMGDGRSCRVMYREQDVIAFEQKHLTQETAHGDTYESYGV